MAKFKMRLKITGFEFEVEGDRSDVRLISQNVAEQIENLIQPGSQIIEGNAPREHAAGAVAPQIETTVRRKGRAKRVSANGSEGGASDAVDFVHDPQKFGMPQQAWNTATKSLWLLYVLKEAKEIGEASARQIAETFNKNFRQSGPIKSFNTTRDLGKAKAAEKPTPVGENNSVDPPTWFLTTDGIRRAQALVAEALKPAPSNGTD